MERGGVQGTQFILQVILARLLMPEDYGIIALVVIFTSIAAVFVQSGLNSALIQKKDADAVDFSSVFYLSLFIAVIIYIIIFFTAPYIASLYEEQMIAPVLRVLSITLIFGAFSSIQNAVVARNLQFRKLFFSSTGAILVSSIVGIYMAYTGLGVWALVGQQISNQFLATVFLWFTVKWRPLILFSHSRVKKLFSFGWKLLASNLIDTLYNDLRSLIIGKIYNPSMLGFYNRGQQFPAVIMININGSIQSVMLPVLASQQDNKLQVKNMVRRTIVTSSFIIFPMMVGLVIVAEPLVKLVLTDKWLPCVHFLQIFCAMYALWPIHTTNLQAINALGRSDIFLKLEIIKKMLGFSILAVTAFYGVYAIAWGGVVSGIISTFINAYPNKKLLGYSYREQWYDIMPPLLISLAMGVVVHLLVYLNIAEWQLLVLQTATGVFLYFGLSRVFKIDSYNYLIGTLKEIFKNGTKVPA